MSQRRFLVTAGLPYSNGRLHVGHIAGAYLPADIYVRYLRAAGAEVRFICGSDDNGVANLMAARKENTTPQELSTRYHACQQRDFAGLGIEFDIYGGTHQPDYVELHNRISQELFLSIHEKGLFTKKRTKQLFDTETNMFLADRYVKGTCPHCKKASAYGDQCEDCGAQIDPLTLIDPVSTITGSTPQVRETTHWFLRLDQLSDRLQAWLESKRDADSAGATWRSTVLNFSLGQLASGLRERAMTRDLDWGVPVPLDDPDAAGKVLYVWFDAPIGYVSFTAKHCADHEGDWQAYTRWWKDPDCKIVHFIGEDNTIFHAITWPAMMLATHDSDSIQGQKGEYQLPHQVVANAFLNIKFPGKEEEKISKSRGTAVWIEDYLKTFDPDPLRYYLTATAPEGTRTAFDIDDLIARNNGELLNAFGNFFNRTMTFAHKYFDGKIPSPSARDDTDSRQLERRREAADKTGAELEDCHFKAALTEVMALARAGNGYFDLTKPFLTRKTDMEACGRAINVCFQTARTLTTLIAPFLPTTAEKCATMLNLPDDWKRWDKAVDELNEGHALGEPVILVKKLDAKELFGE
ncbi:MAG: methionine--tRNA ligase [Planctomycetes bacterium]|nr:methionine--tRNA ligase [Planctomycetota bacterium]